MDSNRPMEYVLTGQFESGVGFPASPLFPRLTKIWGKHDDPTGIGAKGHFCGNNRLIIAGNGG